MLVSDGVTGGDGSGLVVGVLGRFSWRLHDLRRFLVVAAEQAAAGEQERTQCKNKDSRCKFDGAPSSKPTVMGHQ
ncbi:MAG: hypothetical protein F4Y95_01210 [Chloroflexi bacterium]|nr:hypothetical protein [Chloroflexota bacterium]